MKAHPETQDVKQRHLDMLWSMRGARPAATCDSDLHPSNKDFKIEMPLPPHTNEETGGWIQCFSRGALLALGARNNLPV